MSPLDLASQTARRAWASESRLADLAAAPVRTGGIIALKGAGEQVVDSFADAAEAKLTDGDHRIDVTNADVDWVPTAAGVSAQPADIANAADVLATMAAACGIPAILTASGAEGSAAVREAYRTFPFAAVVPVANVLAHELRANLASPDLTLGFEELRAADITGRARAFGSLRQVGYPPSLAAEVCGLPIPPEEPEEPTEAQQAAAGNDPANRPQD